MAEADRLSRTRMIRSLFNWSDNVYCAVFSGPVDLADVCHTDDGIGSGRRHCDRGATSQTDSRSSVSTQSSRDADTAAITAPEVPF